MLFFVCCADENIEKHPDTLEGQRIHNSNVYWGIDDDVLYIWTVNGVSGKLPNRWGNNPYWPWQTRSGFSRVIIEDGVQPDWDISYMFCAFNADNRINYIAVYRGVEDQDAFTYSGSCPWNRNRQLVKHVEFKDIICPKNMSYWFYDMSNLTSIDFGLLDLSRVSSMYSLFNRCSRLKTLDLSSFSTSTVTNIGYMFANTDIESIVLPDTFVTTNVTNMSYLFYYCSKLGEVVLPSNFVIKSGVDVRNMFNGCSSLKSIVLSDGFRFSTSSYYNCVLPTPR